MRNARTTFRDSRRPARAALYVSVALLCFSARPAAADGGRDPDDGRWHFSISPYLWLPSIDTNLRVEGLPFEAEGRESVGGFFDELDFAFMFSAEARKGRLGVLFDMQTLTVSQDSTLQAPTPRDADTELTAFIATLAAAYRVVDAPRFSLDAVAGARVQYADVEIKVTPGALGGGFEAGQHETWVDPVVGARCIFWPTDRWSLSGYADVGGFDVSSKLTWQLHATVGYWFNDHFELFGGYRYYADDFERGDFKFDVDLYGPVVGVTFRG